MLQEEEKNLRDAPCLCRAAGWTTELRAVVGGLPIRPNQLIEKTRPTPTDFSPPDEACLIHSLFSVLFPPAEQHVPCKGEHEGRCPYDGEDFRMG